MTVLSLVFTLALIGCGGDKVVGAGDDTSLSIVQDGYFDGHSQTVGSEVDCFVGDPSWSTFKGTDGNRYVELDGIITVGNINTAMQMQFRVNKANRTFVVNSFQLDEVEQGSNVLAELVTLFDACQ